MAFVSIDPSKVLTTEVPEGIRLFDIIDIDILKAELDNTEDYTELYDEGDRKMWYKSKGEGSGSNNASEDCHDPDAANSTFIRYKYYCDFEDCTMAEFYDSMRDYAKRCEWDTRDAGRRIVNVIHKEDAPVLQYQVVEYMRKRGTLVVSDRDFVTLNAEFWEGDTMYSLGRSIDHPDVPLSEKGAVRSIVLYLGARIEMIEDGSEGKGYKIRAWFVAQTDPKGWIPSSVVNWAQKLLPKEYKQNVERAISLRRQKSEEELQYINYYQINGKKQTI